MKRLMRFSWPKYTQFVPFSTEIRSVHFMESGKENTWRVCWTKRWHFRLCNHRRQRKMQRRTCLERRQNLWQSTASESKRTNTAIDFTKYLISLPYHFSHWRSKKISFYYGVSLGFLGFFRFFGVLKVILGHIGYIWVLMGICGFLWVWWVPLCFLEFS